MIVYFTSSMVLNIMLSFWDIVKTLESSGEIFWSVAMLFVADNWHVKTDVKHVKDIWASIFNKKLASHRREMHELLSRPTYVIVWDDSISFTQNIFFLMFLYLLVISLVQKYVFASECIKHINQNMLCYLLRNILHHLTKWTVA